jgi:hypothetical protein
MNVLAHEPHAWFLLDKDGRLFLDVNCSYSAFSYPILIELLPSEVAEYQAHGVTAINALANAVQFSGLSKEMQARNLSKLFGEEVMSAIELWRGR